jgi:uncharacterized protein (DUF2147 family)
MLSRLSLSCLLGCAFAISGVLSAPAVPAAEPAPSVAQAPASPGDALLGVWKPADMDAEVQISANNGQYVGGVLKAANPAMINTMMLRGITYDAASRSWKGEIFALKRGMFVPMTIRMTPAGLDMVAGSGVFSKTINWVRAQ